MSKQTDIQTLTEGLVKALGFEAEITVTEMPASAPREDMPARDAYMVEIKTDEDASFLIGRHARMLGSLQRVLGAMVFKKLAEPVEILVDVNNYREGQKERLIGIADNVAQRVLEENRPARLSSFSPYERKVIHEHISNNYLSLESFSEGDAADRRLVIGKKAE